MLSDKETQPKTKKPAAGGGAAGFSKRTEQRLGGGVSLFLQTSLGGGVGRLKLEALREEVHHFEGANHTPVIEILYSLGCTAAMQEIQVGKLRAEEGETDLEHDRPTQKRPRHQRASSSRKDYAVSARSMRGQRCGYRHDRCRGPAVRGWTCDRVR